MCAIHAACHPVKFMLKLNAGVALLILKVNTKGCPRVPRYVSELWAPLRLNDSATLRRSGVGEP